jgi:hypothetical protein
MSFSFPNIGSSYRIRSSSVGFGNGWNKGTFMGWVKFLDLAADSTLFFIGSTFTGGQPMMFWRDDWALAPNSTKCLTLMVTAGGVAVRAVSSVNSMNNSNWHHVAGTFDTTSAVTSARKPKLYIDGVLNVSGTTVANHAQNATLSNPDQYFSIGRPNDFLAARGLYGFMEDMRVYDRALSSAEIQTIYNSYGKDTIINGLVVRTLSNLGVSGMDVPVVVPDISPRTINLTSAASFSGNFVLSDNFVLSAKRPRILKGY